MDALDFKFKWLDDNGDEQGFRSKSGSLLDNTLKLDDVELPVAAIVELDHRSNRVILTVPGEEKGEFGHLVFAVKSGSAAGLKEAVGRARSAAWANIKRDELAAAGRSQEFHAVACPHCQATIDLSGMPHTPQVSCEFCHAIGTLPAGSGTMDAYAAVPREKHYRLCDECGMFSKPRQFTVFYFYFLLVLYGFSSRPTWRCPACMRGEAWKMLFGNLPFLLGVPVAMVQLFRAYGGSDVGGMYAGLDRANIKARKGKLTAAIDEYQKVLTNHPVAAGVKYNIGLALMQSNDVAGAAKMFEYALKDCANYQPAASVLANCYEQLGDTVKHDELKKQWGVEDELVDAEIVDDTAD